MLSCHVKGEWQERAKVLPSLGERQAPPDRNHVRRNATPRQHFHPVAFQSLDQCPSRAPE